MGMHIDDEITTGAGDLNGLCLGIKVNRFGFADFKKFHTTGLIGSQHGG